MVLHGENEKLRTHLEKTLGPDRFAAEWRAGELASLEDLVHELAAEVPDS